MLLLDDLVRQGSAVWLDKGQRSALVMWRSIKEWADVIYAWARGCGFEDTVVTVEELQVAVFACCCGRRDWRWAGKQHTGIEAVSQGSDRDMLRRVSLSSLQAVKAPQAALTPLPCCVLIIADGRLCRGNRDGGAASRSVGAGCEAAGAARQGQAVQGGGR